TLVSEGKKGFHFAAQRVIGAHADKKSGTLPRRQVQSTLKDNFYLLPPLWCHRHGDNSHASCFFNHSRAVVQSRFTVAADTPRTRAVSSSDNPPKKRNSTIWPCLESSRESPCKASSSTTTLTWRSGPGAIASSRTSLIPASRFAAR